MVDAVVVDASLASKWVLPEPYTQEALALAEQWSRDRISLNAPGLFLAEITNAVYKRVVRKEMALGTAKDAVHLILQFRIELREEPGLQDRVLELAADLGMPATYDAHYLALAERLGCELWTGDRKLYNAARNRTRWVRWVAEVGSRA